MKDVHKVCVDYDAFGDGDDSISIIEDDPDNYYYINDYDYDLVNDQDER